jgi:N-acetylneuraminic acid mutarotase
MGDAAQMHAARRFWRAWRQAKSKQERNTRMNPLKTLLSTCVRSCVFTGLLVLVLGVLIMLPAVPILAAGSGTWTLTGSLRVARADSTATLLANGQVLVVGGGGTSAELFNPATGAWTLTGSLHTARYYPSATLLANGQVLVVGGYWVDSTYTPVPLASAELFNPATGAWTTTGSMNTARYQHTATLLQNGQVLVAAGYNQNISLPFLTSAELYNPSTGAWTTTGSLHTARLYDTMTLLPNSQVLVTGGYNTTSTINILASAELYNPATGRWTLTKSMHTARTGHAAVLLASGQVLVAAGESSSSFLTSAELYNPASGTWTSTGSLHAARDQHTATLLSNGQVLVAGGQNGTTFIASAERYNPSTGAWTSTGSMHTPRIEHTATLLPNGQVLAAGGLDSNYNYLASAELYTP